VSRRSAWRAAWAGAPFRREAVWTAGLFLAAGLAQTRFLAWNEGRQGVVLADPVLACFAPRDVSLAIFAVVWIGIALAVGRLAREPARLLRTVQGYAYLLLLRVALMWLVPLDPPTTIIPLRDPITESLSTGRALTRDLFFSGHTSVLFLLFLALPRGRCRGVLLVASAAVAFLTVWQHNHYVVDVLTAPFFAYGCVHLAQVGRSPLRPLPQEAAD